MNNEVQHTEDTSFFLNCLLCQTTIDYDSDEFYHFSGMVNGKLDTHIHLCKGCVSRFKLPLININTNIPLEPKPVKLPTRVEVIYDDHLTQPITPETTVDEVVKRDLNPI